MSLNKNEIITLEITSLSNDGNGVGRYDGQAVFVAGSAPGDVLQVRIVKPCKNYAFGMIEAIVTPSPMRIEPDCPIYEKCGGCDLRHITYKAELDAKRTFVADALQRIGGLNVEVTTTVPSPLEERYRNKVQYPVTTGSDGALTIGFFANRSHRVIPCSDCKLQPKLLNEIAHDACALCQRLGVTAYDESSDKGFLRHIYLRHATTTNTVMLCLVVNGKTFPEHKTFCEEIIAKYPMISSIILNSNTEKTNVITGKHCKTLYGDATIQDTLSGVPVALNPLSFYQVNTPSANVLYAKVAELAQVQPHETVLDLYCGAGTIGLSLAHQCKKLIGVEIIPQAIKSAKENANKMGVTHAEFFCSDAGVAAKKLAQDGTKPDVIILDPPRKGCDETTRNAVLSMNPSRIVMVSCNPVTAARDLRFFNENGYTLSPVSPVDLFPRTKHVECVCLMSKIG